LERWEGRKINMKKFGVVGYKGKIGSLLMQRPNFVSIDCDITDVKTIPETEFEVVVNCAAISDVDECEANYDKAIKVNVAGLKNLHLVYGSRVLTISTDQVFRGNSIISPNESAFRSPVNNYGWTKLGAEVTSQMYEGMTIRLSRTVSIEDVDLSMYIMELYKGNEILVPDFFYRNYIHRKYAVDGIEHLVNNWDNLYKFTRMVNYGIDKTISCYALMTQVAIKFGLDPKLVIPRSEYSPNTHAPRPLRGGFKVGLAKRLGFPIFTQFDTVSELAREAHA
jgi:dTDP-4-dehydrorhamnose reductase